MLGKCVFYASPEVSSPLDKKISSPSPEIIINSSPCVTTFFLIYGDNVQTRLGQFWFYILSLLSTISGVRTGGVSGVKSPPPLTIGKN